jgi:hypothetical protein
MNRTVAQAGFWAGVAATALNVLFTIGILAIPATKWTDPQTFASAFKPVEILPSIPSLLLGPAMVVLMLSVHYYAPQDKKILSLAAAAFTILYAGLCGVNYFVQITVVRQSILNGDFVRLAPFIMANPQSAMLAIDTLGYFFLFLATLFAAPIFAGGKLENAIRWLLVISGILGLFGVLGFAIGEQTMYFIGLMGSGLPFLAATMLLAVLFYRLTEKE